MLPLLVRLLGKICEFFSEETAQDGQTWQQGGPVKGQGLPGALLWATLREQRGPGGVCAGVLQLSKPKSCVL